jgi:hypothetical protein
MGCGVRPAKSTLALYCDDEDCQRARNRQRQRLHRKRLRATTVAPQPLTPRQSHMVHRIPGLLGWRADNLMSSATKAGPVTVRWMEPKSIRKLRKRKSGEIASPSRS